MNDNLCTKYDTCVLCGGSNFDLIFKLEDSPLAEDYKQEFIDASKYPLELYLCNSCKHLQLLHAIDQGYLFFNYSYQSQSSPGLVQHFAEYANEFISRLKLTSNDLVVDIGSNDGTLLKQFKRISSVLGVEPSRQLCVEAAKHGIDSVNDYFTYLVAKQIKEKLGKAKLITANNVFAHSRYLDKIVSGVNCLLADNGQFVIEVSYLPLMMKNMVFDFIYHEHLCYHRFKPLQKFFQFHGLRIIRIETNSMKGGTARFTVVKSGSELRADDSIHEATILENNMRLDEITPYRDFWCNITGVKYKVNRLLKYLHRIGRTIVGYGASATTTTLLHHFEVGQYLNCLVDDNPSRVGLYSPGYNLPVLSTDYLYIEQPDYIFITAWRFANQIMKQHSSYRGKWIIPLPSPIEIEGNELCDQVQRVV